MLSVDCTNHLSLTLKVNESIEYKLLSLTYILNPLTPNAIIVLHQIM